MRVLVTIKRDHSTQGGRMPGIFLKLRIHEAPGKQPFPHAGKPVLEIYMRWVRLMRPTDHGCRRLIHAAAPHHEVSCRHLRTPSGRYSDRPLSGFVKKCYDDSAKVLANQGTMAGKSVRNL